MPIKIRRDLERFKPLFHLIIKLRPTDKIGIHQLKLQVERHAEAVRRNEYTSVSTPGVPALGGDHRFLSQWSWALGSLPLGLLQAGMIPSGITILTGSDTINLAT